MKITFPEKNKKITLAKGEVLYVVLELCEGNQWGFANRFGLPYCSAKFDLATPMKNNIVRKACLKPTDFTSADFTIAKITF